MACYFYNEPNWIICDLHPEVAVSANILSCTGMASNNILWFKL